MTQTKPVVLLIEDEARIRAFIRISLQAEGFSVVEAGNAQLGRELFSEIDCDIVILDLGLPDQDGQELIVELRRQESLPILVLSARDDEEEKIRAFDAGANDYLTKPFGIRELVARLKVLIRDLAKYDTPAPQQRLAFDGLTIDYPQHTVVHNDAVVKLSPKEFELLWLLASNYQKLLLQKDILTSVWGVQHRQDTHYLRIFISQLRRKLNDSSRDPGIIETLPGIGYRFLLAPKQK
ncbi:response regulator [Pseudidiomarina halophila]|uniref:DNA-binding response regulator n=1 Tax=Pseudidiomarina halophila TaxID=1449799 RepID=A0A432Y072_9GAMM|nr:response regulator transcription factor [Pseudidiomarina halophila]RUO54343.1 DNA-binding response regulator [Pseudidiomarina halophila]